MPISSGKPKNAIKDVEKNAKQDASDASREAKGAAGEIKGVVGGDGSKRKKKTK